MSPEENSKANAAVVVEKLTAALAIIEPAVEGDIHLIVPAALKVTEIAKWVNGYLAVEKVSRSDWDELAQPLVDRLTAAQQVAHQRIKYNHDRITKAAKGSDK